MTQHNNNLSLNQQDVALLQSRLMTMGHTITTSEVLGEPFGESTQKAVIQFQHSEGLPVIGIVDVATAQAIVSSFESDKTVIMHRRCLSIHRQRSSSWRSCQPFSTPFFAPDCLLTKISSIVSTPRRWRRSGPMPLNAAGGTV